MFYVPFNSQGHIGTGPQHLPLVRLEPTEVTACDKMPSLLTHQATEDLFCVIKASGQNESGLKPKVEGSKSI